MLIGILQTGHVPAELEKERGPYSTMFQSLLADQGFEFQTWSVVDGAFPQDAEAADGWLVTGSRHGVYEDHAWLEPLRILIREIVEAERPLIGVCFGHQVIAQALGGRVEKYEGGWIVGPRRYAFPEGERILEAWHQDQVISLPEGAEVLASGEDCAYAALHYPGRALTVQGHPEFDARVVEILMEHRAASVPTALLARAKADLDLPPDQQALAESFARFYRERRP